MKTKATTIIFISSAIVIISIVILLICNSVNTYTIHRNGEVATFTDKYENVIIDNNKSLVFQGGIVIHRIQKGDEIYKNNSLVASYK